MTLSVQLKEFHVKLRCQNDKSVTQLRTQPTTLLRNKPKKSDGSVQNVGTKAFSSSMNENERMKKSEQQL